MGPPCGSKNGRPTGALIAQQRKMARPSSDGHVHPAAVSPHRSQQLGPVELDPVGHRHANPTKVVVITESADFDMPTVHCKAPVRRPISPIDPDRDVDGVHCRLGATQHRGCGEGVEVRPRDRPELGIGERHGGGGLGYPAGRNLHRRRRRRGPVDGRPGGVRKRITGSKTKRRKKLDNETMSPTRSQLGRTHRIMRWHGHASWAPRWINCSHTPRQITEPHRGKGRGGKRNKRSVGEYQA